MGAIAERPKPGATVGETFSCLIGKCVTEKVVISMWPHIPHCLSNLEFPSSFDCKEK